VRYSWLDDEGQTIKNIVWSVDVPYDTRPDGQF
jgi:hypothetical protein